MLNPLDISMMTESELEEYIKAVESIKFNKKQKDLEMLGLMDIEQYKPYDIQEKFHSSEKRLRIFLGANYTGKTLAGAAETVWWLLKIHPYHRWVNAKEYPVHILGIVADHKQQKLPGGPQDKLLSFLPKDAIDKIIYNKQNAIDVIYLKNGGSFTFKSAVARRDTIAGTRVDGIWIDEESVPNGNYYDELQTRLPSSGCRLFMWFTMTPNLKDGVSWMSENIFPKANKLDGDIGMWEATLHHNPYISDDAKDDLFNNLVGDDMQQQARLLGNWRLKRGLVYNFSAKHHVVPQVNIEEISRGKGVFTIIDPHMSKPIAVMFVAVLEDNSIVIFDELYNQGLVSQVAEWIKAKKTHYYHIDRGTIIDYAGNAKGRTQEGRSITEEFRKFGISARNSRKDVMGGIEIVKKLLYYHDEQEIRPRLFVAANCQNTIREFGRYAWDKTTGKPTKQSDEFMDCIRYLCCDNGFKIFLDEIYTGIKHRTVDLSSTELSLSNKNARIKRRMLQIGRGVGR